MSDNIKRIATLIYKYRLEDLSDDEMQELLTWRNASENNEQQFQEMTNAANRTKELETYKRGQQDQLEGWQLIQMHGLPQMRRSPIIRIGRYTAAATILILIAAGAYLLNSKTRESANIQAPTISKADLPPGGRHATLVLGDGTQVSLDDAQNGNLAKQGGTAVIKSRDGVLSYQTSTSAPAEVLFNTVRIPRGGEYSITLSDGTRVWLNSSSTLRYATAFTGNERLVELTGQAYFEVAEKRSQPFIVQLPNNQKIEVLGTHFDVMAYPDEPVSTTTLLEGAVKVYKGTTAGVLRPGQQAQIVNDGQNNRIQVIKDADVEEATAWKNGFFIFKKASIETVMRQVSRWYDVDIEYRGEPVTTKFYSELPRSSNVSSVFESLAGTGKVHFEIQGKKIIVSR